MASNKFESTIEVLKTEEELLDKFKQERKELQAQTTKLKHSVPKGDKKRKKEAQEEIAKLEASLDAKQKKEMDEWTSLTKIEQEQEAIEESLTSVLVTSQQYKNEEEMLDEPKSFNANKKSKAQRRRDKKQIKEKEREELIKEQEILNKQGPRQQELVKISSMLKARGQVLHEIPADGNCMYNAIAHQLSARNMETSNDELRKKTSDYMRDHPDDFLPFLTNSDTGDPMTQEEFQQYYLKIANSPLWGGQLELRALSEVLRIPIEVLQAEMKPLLIGEDCQGLPITVVYQRHAFRLGEHYNSVADQKPEDKEDSNEEMTDNGPT